MSMISSRQNLSRLDLNAFTLEPSTTFKDAIQTFRKVKDYLTGCGMPADQATVESERIVLEAMGDTDSVSASQKIFDLCRSALM